MNVVGIDQSLTATGVAVHESGETRTLLITSELESGALAIRNTVRYHVGQVLKFSPKADVLFVIEAPIIPRHGGKQSGAGKVLERAWLFGMLFDQLISRGNVATVHPSTRALYATGNGKAEKPEVVLAMSAAYPQLVVHDHNIADALALLGMGARWLGEPIDGSISSRQAKAMRTAHWPTSKEKK